MMYNIFYIYLYRSVTDENAIEMMAKTNIIADRAAVLLKNPGKVSVINYTTKYFKEESIKNNSRILLVDKNGKVILDSHDALRTSILKNKEITESLGGNSSYNYYNFRESGRALYLATPVIDKSQGVVGAVFLSKDEITLFDNINRIINNVIYVSMLGALLTAFIILIISNVLSKPIVNLTNALRSVTMGNYDIELEMSGHDEISELGNSFNLMSARLHTVDEQRAKFVSNVSHELRTPLASLKIISESLLAQQNLPEELMREFLTDIDSEVDRLNKIIDSLLYLVSVENKEQQMKFVPVVLNEMVEGIIRRLKPLSDKKNIFFIQEDLETISLQLDEDKMNQALINIVGNAIKYTPEGGNIFIRTYTKNGMAAVDVQDTGIGIPEKDIKYIFDRFYRVDEARARASGGTGLGLSIALQIINLHRGQIDVTSQENIGTVFTVMIPKNLGEEQ